MGKEGKEGHSKKGKSQGAGGGPGKENVGQSHVGEKDEEEGQGQLLRASDTGGGNSVYCVDYYTVIFGRSLFSQGLLWGGEADCPCGVLLVGPRAGVVLAAVAGTEVRTGALSLALHWGLSSGQAGAQTSLFIALTWRGQAAS